MADRRERLRDALLGAPWDGMQRGQATGTLRNAPPMSLREKIMDLIVGGGRAAGFSATQANRMRNDAGAAVDFIPGVGDAVGADDAFRDYRAGNYGAAALGAGAAAVGLIPGVGDAASAGIKKGIKAYHGSPHDFDAFSLDKIGTGEGAQAYGHGLYFAEAEDVARSYKQTLERRNVTGTFDGQPLDDSRDWWKAVDKLNEEDWKQGKFLDLYGRMGGDKDWFVKQMRDDYRDRPDMIEALEKWSARMDASHRPGSMYEVNINANPDEFLDWDAPLSEQPEALRRKLGWTPEAEASYRATESSDTDALLGALYGDGNYSAQKLPVPKGLPPLSATGADIVKGNSVFDRGSDAVKSNKLREAGIPGVKYLDQGSRAAGDGSRNYVVFDDKLIEIVRKYGLAAAIASGVISAEMGRQMQEQGDI